MDGATGATGVTGATGDDGDTGVQGPQVATGATGQWECECTLNKIFDNINCGVTIIITLCVCNLSFNFCT